MSQLTRPLLQNSNMFWFDNTLRIHRGKEGRGTTCRPNLCFKHGIWKVEWSPDSGGCIEKYTCL